VEENDVDAVLVKEGEPLGVGVDDTDVLPVDDKDAEGVAVMDGVGELVAVLEGEAPVDNDAVAVGDGVGVVLPVPVGVTVPVEDQDMEPEEVTEEVGRAEEEKDTDAVEDTVMDDVPVPVCEKEPDTDGVPAAETDPVGEGGEEGEEEGEAEREGETDAVPVPVPVLDPLTGLLGEAVMEAVFEAVPEPEPLVEGTAADDTEADGTPEGRWRSCGRGCYIASKGSFSSRSSSRVCMLLPCCVPTGKTRLCVIAPQRGILRVWGGKKRGGEDAQQQQGRPHSGRCRKRY
jgi:hypothetical protein